MFTNLRLSYLHKKFVILTEKEMEYLRKGDFQKADEIEAKANEVARAIEKLTSESIDKANKAADASIAKADEAINQFFKDAGIDVEGDSEKEFEELVAKQHQ